ncbi:nuclear envelope pore membrane protein POM 121C-like [Mesocricetus auratus]|uniref:Nuclear envelope pore membrane protein POM 121C-like n=1 Tax=Mesocricetus auratus TaxID=10036 RepID=A0ABM2XME7_MESAU|nr:nuclear envelope pore membrane protein POM 121C-like [Mesocricetus auratus]
MGGYLGRSRPRRQSLTVPTADLQNRPSPPVHGVSRSLGVNSMDQCLNMAGSLSLEDDETLANFQEHPGCVMVVHTQRYPVEKARDLLAGDFSSMFLTGQHNSVPTLSGSRMSRSSMILKVVSTKGRATFRFVLGQPFLTIWSFLSGYFSTQSRKKTRISALQETSKSKSKRMRAKKKKDPTILGKGGEGFATLEECSTVVKRPSDEGKDCDGDVSAPSAFRRLIVNGVLSSFVPRPGPLCRDIHSKNSAKSNIKESQIAFKSSYKRNAIASSYSSTLAQWPPERIRVHATGGAALGAVSGAAPGTAAGATPDDAAGATQGVAGGAVSGAVTGTVSQARAASAAPKVAAGAAAHATQGAAPDDAAGATRGAAPDDACTARGVARATRATAAGASPGTASGATADAASGAAADAASGAAADAAPGAAPGAASGAAADAASGAAADADPGAVPGAASGAAADAALGAAADADPGAVPGAAPCALPFPSPDSSRLKEAANEGDEKDGASSGNVKKKEKKTKKEKKKERKEKKEKLKKAKQAAVTDAPQVKQGNPRKGPPKSDIPKPVKRKIPLLLPSRRDVPLVPPPPPGLYFRITTEDFDLEKKTAMQWINKVLKDDGAKARCN